METYRDIIEESLEICEEIAESESSDSETRVGALVLNSNGDPLTAANSFVNRICCSYLPTVRPDKYEYILHAEMNVIAKAAKEGYSLKNGTMYVTHSPCLPCLRMARQSGITTIIFKKWYKDQPGIFKYETLIDLDVSLMEHENYTVLLID